LYSSVVKNKNHTTMAKISSFIISMLLVGLFVTIFANYYTDIDEKYDPDLSPSANATIQAFNKFGELQESIGDINQTLFEQPSGESGVTDLVGKFLGAGFNVLRVAAGSFTAFYDIAANALNNAFGLPPYFLSFLTAIAIVVILFIIVRALTGGDV
jgi:hypothetical protein